jgi:hypothetical protein
MHFVVGLQFVLGFVVGLLVVGLEFVSDVVGLHFVLGYVVGILL